MWQNIEDKTIKDKLRFFFRFLKENKLYTAFIRNIRNPKCYGIYQTHHENWSFERCAIDFGVEDLITVLMCWDKTIEGYNYWADKYSHFRIIFWRDFCKQNIYARKNSE